MTQPGPRVLAFSDSRMDGFPVSSPEGVVASLDVGMFTSRFGIYDVNGVEIAHGKKAFLGEWYVEDAYGNRILELEQSFGRKHALRFSDGRVCEVQGRWFGRDWTMVDQDGRVVLQSVPTSSSFGFHPDQWQVEQDGSLTLVQFVAAVETYRRLVQARQNAAANA